MVHRFAVSIRSLARWRTRATGRGSSQAINDLHDRRAGGLETALEDLHDAPIGKERGARAQKEPSTVAFSAVLRSGGYLGGDYRSNTRSLRL